ncbi:MAG: DNA-3-methyladenine glycosylase [Actinomycetota bacterium]
MPKPEIVDAERDLARRDPVMRRLIKEAGPCTLGARRMRDHFGALVRSIVFQQLAGKAAAAIHGRFVALFDGQRIDPDAVLAAGVAKLRTAGLSGAKATSIMDLATKVADGTVPLRGISRYADEEIIERLSGVRGIGKWTAEMFLMFQLGRLDVWPVDDYGVRKGYSLAYDMAELPKPKELDLLGKRFRPYRSIAAWYCWRAVDTITPG